MPGVAIPAQISKQRGVPNPQTGLTTPYLQFQPLAGMTAQDTTPYTSPIIKLAPGMLLELVLSVTNLAPGLAVGGTLDIEIQDIANPSDPNEQWRPLAEQFFQAPSTPAPSAIAPFVAKLVSATRGYVRIVATPGKAAGQAATWQITGQGYVPGQPLQN